MKNCKRKGFYTALLIGGLALFTITYTVDSIKGVSERLASVNRAKNSLETSEDIKINNDLSSNYEIKNHEVKDKMKDKRVDQKEIKKDAEKKQVMTQNKKTIQSKNLYFDEEKGLNWPIKGKIVKEFSMDRLIYFPTLGSYKTNPAIFIAAKNGDTVKSAYMGDVINVGENKEIGKYVEVSIGNEYELLYGQLKNIKVKKGDRVDANTVIGEIGKQSSYYIKEGNHLYFKVIQEGKPVNPMLLLR
jgi:murein DD-endopeptidase MepM/ murein hydrolase activator NlpD